MPYEFQSLDESLADLATLRKVLGEAWIKCESDVPAIDSSFPLARTLRIKELRNLTVTLDRRLADLWDVVGARDWRNRLRNNGQEFRELLTELAFADLLRERGFHFVHPSDGPDLDITIDDGPPLLIEATTPRIIAWDDDLDNRLWVLSREFGYSVRVEPLSQELPILNEQVTERMMKGIIADAANCLSTATQDDSVIEQSFPSIGMRIVWARSAYPVFSGRNLPNSSPIRAFNYISIAAENKVGQLRRFNAHTLLIGTNQLPFPEWAQYVASVRSNVPFFGRFDWSQIHPQVHHIILFQATYGDGRYPAIDVWERPGETANSSGGLRRFFEDLRLTGMDYHRQAVEDERKLVKQLMRYEKAKRRSGTE
jgi:hypothetical protein